MRIALAALLCLSASTARADDGYQCHEAAPNTKLTASFGPTVSLADLAIWVMGFSCKNVVFSADVAKHATRLTVLAPKPMTPKQALQLFVDAVEATGLVVQQKPDSIVIKLGPSMPKSCPDLTVAPPPGVPVAPVAPVVTPPEDPEVAKLGATIKKLDDTHYEIPRATVDAVLANPLATSKGVRVVPSVKNGKPDGFKLYAIRDSSVVAKLGLVNGDTLVSINQLPLTSAEEGLEVYTRLRTATRLEVAIVRRGKPVTLVWTIK